MKIGFIGLGNVGGKLARSLIRNNYNLSVIDLDQKLTKIFEKLGGKVKYFGKPYPEVYEKAYKNLQGKKVICIGDNLNTDIKGANMQNFDSLLINNGIHKNELSNGIKELVKKYNVNLNYTQTELKW